MSINYDELRQNIIKEHNLLLSDPQSYIPIIDRYITYFKGDVLYLLNQQGIKTKEGITAFNNAREFLVNIKPSEPLKYDERLFNAANDHLKDIGSKGILSHEGTDGSSVSDRIERYSEWEGLCVENIEFGGKTAVDIIISLLVDDGFIERPHRKNMFSKEVKYFGIAVGDHKESGVVTIIKYVGSVRDREKPFFDYKNYKYQYPILNEKLIKSTLKNSFQYDDEDAPDGTISVKITKHEKHYDGKKLWITKKIYSLSNGSQEIVEIEDF